MKKHDKHSVRIHEYAREQDGYWTHVVYTGACPNGVKVSSAEDALKVAEGYNPGDGKPVTITHTSAKR